MAVLGSFTDRVANAFTLAGPTCQTAQPIFQTTPHSLGAAPDYVIPIVASYGPNSGGPQDVPIVGQRGGNASLNTVFAAIATGRTIAGIVSVDVISHNVWSAAR